MKLYDSVGPNPRIVRMFMAEKGIEMPKQAVDLRKGENREAEHLKRNPHGQMPTLELDDGSYLSEITAICEYLEEKKPSPPMIGSTPEERAECRMWTRRVDLNICEMLANGFRYRRGAEVLREADPGGAGSLAGAEDGRAESPEMARWPDGRWPEYICGKRFTLADILSLAGSISAARSASRSIAATRVSPHGSTASRSGRRRRRRNIVIPGWSEGPDPESRDSGFDASHRPGMTKSPSRALLLPLGKLRRQKLRQHLDAGRARAAGRHHQMHSAFRLLPALQDHLDLA